MLRKFEIALIALLLAGPGTATAALIKIDLVNDLPITIDGGQLEYKKHGINVRVMGINETAYSYEPVLSSQGLGIRSPDPGPNCGVDTDLIDSDCSFEKIVIFGPGDSELREITLIGDADVSANLYIADGIRFVLGSGTNIVPPSIYHDDPILRGAGIQIFPQVSSFWLKDFTIFVPVPEPPQTLILALLLALAFARSTLVVERRKTAHAGTS